MDPRNHTFIVPRRDRVDSMELNQSDCNNLSNIKRLDPIMEKKDEDDNGGKEIYITQGTPEYVDG